MPLLSLQTDIEQTPAARESLLGELSGIVAAVIGKPESSVMVVLQPAGMAMAATGGQAAFVEVRSIGGLSEDVNRRLSERICSALQTALGVPPERVYINFIDIARADWGWNGSTFA